MATARQKAIQTFNINAGRVHDLMIQIDNQDTRLRGLNIQINTADSDLDTNDTASSTNLDRLQKLCHNVQEQKETLQQEIIQLYDSAIRTKDKKTNLIDLHIPKDIQSGKGQMLIDSMKAYLRGRDADRIKRAGSQQRWRTEQ